MNTFPPSFASAVSTPGPVPAYQQPQPLQYPGEASATGRQATLAPAPAAFVAAPVVYASSTAVGNAGGVTAMQTGRHPGGVAATGSHPRFQTDQYKISPLCHAASTGDIDTVLAQLQQGCAVNAWEQGEAHRYTPLIAAAENGHTDIVELLIGAGADVNLSDGQGCSALYCAAMHGRADIVSLLLGEEGIRVDEKMLDGTTAFYQAAAGGHVAAAEVLLNGSVVSFGLRQECLASACRRGDIAIVALLFRRGGMGLGEMNRNSCLHLAAAGGRTALVAWLLACGVAANANGIGNLTPLQHACLGGHIGVVGQLLAYLGVHVNDPSLSTPPLLHLAIEAGHVALMEYLLRAGAAPNAQHMETGRTGLMLAASKGRVDMLQMLLACPAIKLDLVCRSGWNALQLATFGGGRDAAICLLDAGAYVEAPNDDTYPNSLLWRAVERKDGELFRLMLKQTGVRVGPSAPFFNAAWSHAAQSGCADIVECLLEAGHAGTTSADLVRYLHQASSKAGHAGSISAVWKANAHYASALAAGRSSAARSEYEAMIHGFDKYVPAIVTADLRSINTFATGSWLKVVAQTVPDAPDAPLQAFDRLIAPTGATNLTVDSLRENLLLHLHGQRLLMAVALPLADCLTACCKDLALPGSGGEMVNPQQNAMVYAAALGALNLQEHATLATQLYTFADLSADGVKRLAVAAQGQLDEVCNLAGQVGTLLGAQVIKGIMPACMKHTNARYDVDVAALTEALLANGLMRPLSQVVAHSWNTSVIALMATPLAIPPCSTFFHVTQIVDHAMRRLGQSHFAPRLLASLNSAGVPAALRQMTGKAEIGAALPTLFRIQVDQLKRYCVQLHQA